MSTIETVTVVVISWVFAAGLNYGLIKARVRSIESRVSRLEDEKFLTRTEYESRHKELIDLIRLYSRDGK